MAPVDLRAKPEARELRVLDLLDPQGLQGPRVCPDPMDLSGPKECRDRRDFEVTRVPRDPSVRMGQLDNPDQPVRLVSRVRLASKVILVCPAVLVWPGL